MAKDGIDGFFLNCQLDEKFELIEAEFGLKGFAIIIKLFQRIYGEHGYYCEYNSDISLLLAAKWNVTSSGGDADNLHRQLPVADKSSTGGCHNLIDHVVAASVRRGIFDKTMYEKYGILTSVGIQKRYMTATRKRIDVVLKNEYLLLNDVKNGKTDGRNGKTDGRNGKTDGSFEQSKVKESKVNKSKVKEDICAELDEPAPTSNIRIPLNDKTFYDVPLQRISEWKDVFPAVNVEEQLKRMVVWCNANPTKKKTRRGVERFIANWLSREQDRGDRYCGSVSDKNRLEEWANG